MSRTMTPRLTRNEFKSRVFPYTGHMMEFVCPNPGVRCFSVTEVDCNGCSAYKEYNSSEEKTTQNNGGVRTQ